MQMAEDQVTPLALETMTDERETTEFPIVGGDQDGDPNLPLAVPKSGRTATDLPWSIFHGDAGRVLSHREFPTGFNCIITSPPYFWQRDYKVDGQIGLEGSIRAYVENIANVMDQCRKVLAKDGLLFLNLGDTYYSAKGQPKGNDKKNAARRFGLRVVDASGLGVPRKTTLGMPWRVGLEMISRGWVLRSPIIWKREASPPEPTAHDRPWRTYEMLFMFSKAPKYYFDREALGPEEDVWTISDRPESSSRGVHSAAFPEKLVRRCLDVGCKPGGSVLDPFAGSGTVLRTALRTGRSAVGIDLSAKYCEYMDKELRKL